MMFSTCQISIGLVNIYTLFPMPRSVHIPKRRGISGGVSLCEGGLVCTLAKQQQALSLSSCEAELYALQLLSRESVSFGKFVHRMLFCLDEVSEAEDVVIVLESDSSRALQLVQALDMPKRSRHVEIPLLWLCEQVGSGKITIQHRPGTDSVSDLFMKCLPTRTFLKHYVRFSQNRSTYYS